jgi:hypothetical protein
MYSVQEADWQDRMQSLSTGAEHPKRLMKESLISRSFPNQQINDYQKERQTHRLEEYLPIDPPT